MVRLSLDHDPPRLRISGESERHRERCRELEARHATAMVYGEHRGVAHRGLGADHAGGRDADRWHACHRAAHGEQEIARELASPPDALRVALMMLARRGRLEIGDVLKAMAPS